MGQQASSFCNRLQNWSHVISELQSPDLLAPCFVNVHVITAGNAQQLFCLGFGASLMTKGLVQGPNSHPCESSRIIVHQLCWLLIGQDQMYVRQTVKSDRERATLSHIEMMLRDRIVTSILCRTEKLSDASALRTAGCQEILHRFSNSFFFF